MPDDKTTKPKAKAKAKKRKRVLKSNIAQKREQLLENLRTGMSIEAACSQTGIGYSTYYQWLSESGDDGEWTADVNAALNLSEPVLLHCIKGHAVTDWRAAAWMLERRWPERWSQKREVDVSVNQSSSQEDDIILSMINQLKGETDEDDTPNDQGEP